MNQETTSYLDFTAFAQAIDPADQALLANRHLLFCYPVRSSNEFEMADYPVSQGLLMAVCEKVGCRVSVEMALIGDTGVVLPEQTDQEFSHIIIHPMISIIDQLPDIAAAYGSRYPEARIVLQNSDQHQHEKLIGGPASREIARQLLKQISQVDWVIRGFSEHPLISLLLDRPTHAVTGRHGEGDHGIAFFALESLPPHREPEAAAGQGGSIRVQRSRGCLSGCTYCIEGQANKSLDSERSWDGVAIEDFVERLQRLGEKGFFLRCRQARLCNVV